ncbi:MAG: cysteine desulfurase family protein [bacterium]
MNPSEIYLDNAATTRCDPRVVEAMIQGFQTTYGNPSSIHSQGTFAKEILERSRSEIASLLGAFPGELIFTGSGTEANNLALKGIAEAHRNGGNHLIISSIEHDCILKTCQWLESRGFFITYIPVDHDGLVDLDFLSMAINKKTILVSVMHANNEIGTVEPVNEIGRLCHQRNVFFHTDACQSFGKIPVDVNEIHCDLLTINAHKIHGPKGVGGLYVRNGIRVAPLLHGGGQESGVRSSTENIPGILGFSAAARIAVSEMETEACRMKTLRDHMTGRLTDAIPGIYFNGHPEQRIFNNVNFCIDRLEGEGIRLQLLLNEKGMFVSTGSACSSNDQGNPSHVLRAIGLNAFQSRGAIRVSLGRETSTEEVNRFTEALAELIGHLRPIQ